MGTDIAEQTTEQPVQSKSVVGLEGIPGQGPHMVIVLKVCGEQIEEARFATYGCPAANACGQFVTERIEGHSLADAAAINSAAIIAGAGQMPLGREHCPPMTVNALKHALSQVTTEP